MVKISVVLPCYNESDVIEKTFATLRPLLEEMGKDFEIIFVDNGATDNQLEIMRSIFKKHPKIVKVVSLSRNFGYQISMSAGLSYAEGDAVILIDADLQDPPELLKQFVTLWEQGYEVIYGVRVKRDAPFVMKGFYKLFYYLMNRFSDIYIPIGASEFGLLDRKVVREINAMPESVRFIRGLRAWVGFKQIGIPYNRLARKVGLSKFRYLDSLSLALDGLLSFSTRILTIASLFGLLCTCISFALLAYILCWKFFNSQEIPGYAAIMVTISFFGGVIIGLVGLVGMFVERIFLETKRRPRFVVREIMSYGSEKS